MAFIPDDAKWYLADIIEEIQVEDEANNIVHINTVLVRADSPEEAYTKALELGAEYENSYQNTDGQTVTASFKGLSELSVIHDDLEHGAELMYRRKIGVSKKKLAKMVTQKNDLAVFRPRQAPNGPNFMASETFSHLINELKLDRETLVEALQDDGTKGSDD